MKFFVVAHNDSKNSVYGRHESWITCHGSRVMNHDLAITPQPVKKVLCPPAVIYHALRNFLSGIINQWTILHGRHDQNQESV